MHNIKLLDTFASETNFLKILDVDPLPYGSLSFILLAQRAIEFYAPPNWLAWSALLFIAFLCLLISGFMSGSEMAFFGLTPGQVEELGESDDPKSKKAFTLLNNSERLLATILISNNLVNITMVVVLTFAISQTVRFSSPIVNFLMQTVFLTFLLLLFGEIFPKLVARGRNMRWVLVAAGPMTVIYHLTAPFAKVMVKSGGIVNKIVTKKPDNLSTDELETALELSDMQEGKDKEMLEGILTFGEKDAGDIMISRVDVTDIEYHDSWPQVMEVILKSGFSRIPVYDTSQDTIRGILYSKDMLPYVERTDENFRWQSLIRDAFFVPETRMIDDLLEDFRQRKVHIAIVVDEYGGTQGIVTLEDVIEEIVGEIDDEYDDTSSRYRKIDNNTFIFDAKTSIGNFCHDVDIEEESLGDIGEAETIAGLLLEIKGDFPTRKEILQRGPCTFEVLQLDRHRITRVRVTIDREGKENKD